MLIVLHGNCYSTAYMSIYTHCLIWELIQQTKFQSEITMLGFLLILIVSTILLKIYIICILYVSMVLKVLEKQL